MGDLRKINFFLSGDRSKQKDLSGGALFPAFEDSCDLEEFVFILLRGGEDKANHRAGRVLSFKFLIAREQLSFDTFDKWMFLAKNCQAVTLLLVAKI